MLGIFGWLLKLGCVEEVRLSMMMGGHTHEQDIEAIFRCVSEYWKRQAKVLTPSVFLTHVQESVEGTVVHPRIEDAHDFSGFFCETILL
eukprot:4483765-Pleurochrysis_carterae.AAC.2